MTLLGLFVSDGQIPLWVLAIILLKEAAMVIGGGVALKRGIVVYALPIGKVTTVDCVLSIVARFLSWTQIADTLLWISVALSMVALIWYAVDLMKKLGTRRQDFNKIVCAVMAARGIDKMPRAVYNSPNPILNGFSEHSCRKSLYSSER